MKVLVACEESQTVCKAFRVKGHEAYSCDIQDCSGGHPEWHIKGDVLKILNPDYLYEDEDFMLYGIEFNTCDGINHYVEKWDLIIAHPPCTDLCVSGARHFEKKRADGRQRESIEFFAKFLNADCDKIAVENPVGIISGDYIPQWFPDLAEKYGLPIKSSQIIQPFQFGDPHRKTTCLWLKGLPNLIETNVVEPTLVNYTCKNGKTVTFDEFMIKGFNGDRAKHRSKTFQGIADAMADQWGSDIEYIPPFDVVINGKHYLTEEEAQDFIAAKEEEKETESSDKIESRKMKIYIAGSISNNPNYIEQFEKAERMLVEEGHAVINPAKNTGFTYKDYIDIGLFELMHCEAIYLLDGYETSKGARLELLYAETTGMKILKGR